MSSQRRNSTSIEAGLADRSWSISKPAILVFAPWQPVQYCRRRTGGSADAAVHPRKTESTSLTRNVSEISILDFSVQLSIHTAALFFDPRFDQDIPTDSAGPATMGSRY